MKKAKEKKLMFGEKCPMDDLLTTLTDYAGKNCKKYCKTCNGINEEEKYVLCAYSRDSGDFIK